MAGQWANGRLINLLAEVTPPKAGEVGHGAACWVPTTAVCALGRTHRLLFHIQEDHRRCLAWVLVLGLPGGTKTVVYVSREEAES